MTEKYFPDLTDLQRSRLASLRDLYAEWNDRINVISRKDIINFDVSHLLHSLAIARFITFESGSQIIDVGTGGGLPGIPLAIIFPDVNFTLIDSIAKKIRVVTEIAEALSLTNVTARATRSEEQRGSYDFVISRAVTAMKPFISMTSHLVTPGFSSGIRKGFIFLKGGDLAEELGPFTQKAAVKNISDWFDEPFFETKKVIYLPR